MIQIDMKMPTSCEECKIWSMCWAEGPHWWKRREDCPLHEVTADPDTISRKQAIDAIDILRGGCITDDVKNFVRYQLLGLPPSPSRPQWISCSERLPEHSCQALVTTKWDTEYSVEYGFYWGEDNKWGTITNNVIAWMPLPEPYRP